MLNQRFAPRLEEITFPDPKDKWSEALSFSEGYWEASGAAQILLDMINKVVGDHSIHIYNPDPSYVYASRAYINLSSPINLNIFSSFNFYLALQQEFTGECALVFWSGSPPYYSGYAKKAFGSFPGIWVPQSHACGEEHASEYVNGGVFRWDQVTCIEFYARGTGSYYPSMSWRIDCPHFVTTIIPPLPLLKISSYDQNMNNLPAQQGVKVIYQGIEQYVDVPFASRVSNGEYTFVVQETADRIFKFWKKPDGIEEIAKYVTLDIQADTELEIHWEAMALPEEWLKYALIAARVGFISLGIYLLVK